MKRLASLLLAAVCSSVQADEELLNLDDIVNLSLHHNPYIKRALGQNTQYKGESTQADSAYLPQVSLTLDEYYQNTKYQDNTATQAFTDSSPTSGNMLVFDATVTQLIYDFGKTLNKMDAANKQVEAFKHNTQSIVSQVVLLAHQNYYNVLKTKRLIEVSEEKLSITKQQLYRAQQYFKQGVVNKIDVTDAEVEVSNAMLDLIKAKQNYKLARITLQNTVGYIPNKGSYKLYERMTTIDNLVEYIPSISTDDESNLKIALDNRPELKQYRKMLSASQSMIDSKRGGYWPTIAAAASYSKTDSSQIVIWDQIVFAGVQAKWDIFTGFKTDGEVDAAKGTMIQSQAQLQQTYLTIEKQVADADVVASEKLQEINLTHKLVKLAYENLDLATERYINGLGNIVEFNDAQVKYTRAKTDFVSAYYDYLTAVSEIHYARGDYSGIKAPKSQN